MSLPVHFSAGTFGGRVPITSTACPIFHRIRGPIVTKRRRGLAVETQDQESKTDLRDGHHYEYTSHTRRNRAPRDRLQTLDRQAQRRRHGLPAHLREILFLFP